jgi:hypothetical protein
MEAVKHFLWLNVDRSCLFFANHVLLVEGQTEVAIISKLIADGRIKSPDCGLYVLDCLGKFNIHRFMHFLTRLGIPHAVLLDDDGGEEGHAEINKLIDDSAHPALTLCVQKIPGNLEAMLAVPTARPNRRKPQHLLYLYETGQIEQARIDAFCSLVEGCLPIETSGSSADRTPMVVA